jgi:hypothetical protein
MGKNKLEPVHIRIRADLFKELEDLRKNPHTDLISSRSDVYEETLAYGNKIQRLRREIGDKEFTRIWNLLNKLDLKNVDIAKFM